VGATAVEEVAVLAAKAAQMGIIKEEDVVEELATKAAGEALRDGVIGFPTSRDQGPPHTASSSTWTVSVGPAISARATNMAADSRQISIAKASPRRIAWIAGAAAAWEPEATKVAKAASAPSWWNATAALSTFTP
jgi:hypothetical protein